MDSPPDNLTPNSRALKNSLKDWHRLTNHEFDLQLDFLWAIDSSPTGGLAQQSGKDCGQIASMDTTDQPSDVQAGGIIDPSADVQSSPPDSGSNQQLAPEEVSGDTLSHVPNNFADPDYHVQGRPTGSHGSLPCEQVYSSSSNSTAEPASMQRGMTDSVIQPHPNWSPVSSHGTFGANGNYQASNMHHGMQGNFARTSNMLNASYGRPRAQTADYNIGSHFTQQYSAVYGQNRWQPMTAGSTWGSGGILPTSAPVQSGYHSNASLGRNEAAFNSSRTSNLHAAQLGSHYPNNVMTFNAMQRDVKGVRDRYGLHHHGNNGHVMNPVNVNNHSSQHNSLMAVPQSMILKSHSSVHPNGADKTTMSSRRKPRDADVQVAQQILTDEDDNPDTMNEEQIRDQLNYFTIEAARQAERPKFRANPQKDETIPRTDGQKQYMVLRMVKCMRKTDTAKDNEGMIKQWIKLLGDGPRVEQAAWRILDMVLQMHVDGIPLSTTKPHNVYAKMLDRWNAICEGLTVCYILCFVIGSSLKVQQHQKTLCKHLLGADFSAQLVNDPGNATVRVVNNRKVNAGKKTWLDEGRRATRGEGQKGRQGSSMSLDEDNPFAGLNDEDAEGENDDEYPYLQENIDARNASANQQTPVYGPSISTRRLKREEDFGDPDFQEKGRKRPRRAVSGAAKKQSAPQGSRSKYQAINGIMVDLNDKSREALIYAAASPEIQDRYTAIHYPGGRPPTSNGPIQSSGEPLQPTGSRRSSRAAAPTTFRGADNSATGDSGSPYDGTDDECHQGARHQ
ncbi:MAG: hypothetical protein Q9219_004994 [cf. Caloplaca sp. 3 TL-2023]